MEIRVAKIQDYKAVEEIMQQVQQLHVEWRPDIYRPVQSVMTESYFNDCVKKEECYVAEMDGQIVGVLEIELRQIRGPHHVSRDVIFIDSMAVKEGYRGHGIGKAFFEIVKRIKEEKNLDGIELQVNAKNKAAYEMYKKCGFTEKSINMELREP